MPQNNLKIESRLFSLARDVLIYGIGNAINKALTLITFPLLARYFSVEDYGWLDLINTCVVLATVLLVFGQDVAVARFFYERSSKSYRRQIATQSLVLQLGVICCSIPLLVFAILWWDRSDKYLNSYFLALAQVPFFVLQNFSQNILKWTFQRSKFLIISVGSVCCTVIGILLVVYVGRKSITDVFLVFLVVRAIFGLLGIWFVRNWLAIPRNMKRVATMLPFAFPFAIIGVLSTVVPVCERIVIEQHMNAHSLGLFSVGSKIASLISLPILAFEMSWGPFSLSLFRESKSPYLFDLVLRTACSILLVLVLLLTSCAEYLVNLLGSSKYAGAGNIVFFLTLGLAVQALGSITSVGLMIKKRADLKLYGYLIMVFTSLLFMWILVPHYGAIGVGAANAISLTLKTLVESIISNRYYRLGANQLKPFLIILLVVLIGLLDLATRKSIPNYTIHPMPLVGCLVVAAVSWIYLFSREEREKLFSVTRSSILRMQKFW
ncbi:MAG: oligosaccharide flippase family protein [Planctomycetales bacterium]|nr:oligosaccharide flippase family protein [Planctomycetales bacterium]